MLRSSHVLGTVVLLASLVSSLGGCSVKEAPADGTSSPDPNANNGTGTGTGDPQTPVDTSTPPGDVPADGTLPLPSTTATMIAVGRLHTCALTVAGGVRCWGSTEKGAVGNGAPLGGGRQAVPVEVKGLGLGVRLIAAGGDHTCAVLAANGNVKCWGGNDRGQLGNDAQQTSSASNDSSLPVDVVGLTGVSVLSAGDGHTCAVTKAGEVKCWGSNGSGQLGTGTMDSARTPVTVTGLTSGGVVVSAGFDHTCASDTSGAVRCWGSNAAHQLGTGAVMGISNVPLVVPSLSAPAGSAFVVSAGFRATCATLAPGGGVKCWGENDKGQTGNGVLDQFAGDVEEPSSVVGLSAGTVTSASMGTKAACATIDGAAKCWGINDQGQLGNGEGPGFTTAAPVSVKGLETGTSYVQTYEDHTCALMLTGAVKCWGENASGALGNTTIDANSNSLVPIAVLTLP
jgi:alpha-tubulin suppressor-like RCC1 family protein